MKTSGECLHNNCNAINFSKGEERTNRIKFQNSAATLKREDFEFYEKYMWKEEDKINEVENGTQS